MLKVSCVAISKLKPWDQNPRLNDHAVGKVAESIKKFGFNVPILCDSEMNVIAGHTRLKAAKRLQMSEVPVIVLRLSSEQRRLFAIAENKTGEIADWDNPVLSRLLTEFKNDDIDLSALGFSAAEMHALLAPKEDFDWSCIEQEEAIPHEEDYVLLPVKIPQMSFLVVKKLIAERSRIHSIRGKNAAIKAGRLVMRLLGVAQ
jgi:site-specific DNA-methyltransferase (adenine-specific)